jgi:Protein of unknown function (DUF1573)
MAGSSHIKPNEKGTVTVKLNTSGRKGLIEENVEVISNDPLRPQITLTIKAFVTDTGVPLFPQ